MRAIGVPKVIAGFPAYILPSKTFDFVHHRFISKPINQIDFMITDSQIEGTNILISTNYFWRKSDFDKKNDDWDKNDYHQIVLVLHCNVWDADSYNEMRELHNTRFSKGNKLSLKNAWVRDTCVYARNFLEFNFDPILKNDYNTIDRLRYRLYSYGVDYRDRIGAGLIMAFGSEVEYISDVQLAKEHDESLERRNKEAEIEAAKRDARLAKQITPEKALEIVRLYDVDGLSFGKIAKIFEVNPSTIKTHYHRNKG